MGKVASFMLVATLPQCESLAYRFSFALVFVPELRTKSRELSGSVGTKPADVLNIRHMRQVFFFLFLKDGLLSLP